ncbi:MAG: RIP metalloprotease RseP [bacterium]|nr:RIP metalloprotease RseP [Planctomycetota bacterium]HIL51112.1 RIP metalloprotease RseP [Planctomycetota bacterium]
MDLSSIPQYIQVVLGIGLVIFVHESGHFFAARWCGVRVHVFSLGFGPRLMSWTRGHTTYQIAAVPLGGYVRMAGDEGSESDGGEPEPWELAAKSVPQRFLIYSGGVLSNVLFGLVVFPILFLLGIPSFEPITGQVEAGSPAWHAGVEPGSRVLQVNGREIYDITQVSSEVAYGGSDPVELLLRPPGSETTRRVLLEPRFDDQMGLFTIGRLGPAADRAAPLFVAPGSQAEQAGVVDGDRLLGVTGVSAALSPQRQLALAMDTEEPISLRLERDGEELLVQVEPRELKATGRPLLGVQPLVNLVTGLRADQAAEAMGLEVGDRVLRIDGQSVDRTSDILNLLFASPGPHAWQVSRAGDAVALSSPALAPAAALALLDSIAFEADMLGARVAVLPRSAADKAGLRSGDLLEKIDGTAVNEYDDIRQAAVLAGRQGRAMEIDIARARVGQAPEFLSLSVLPAAYARSDYGLGIKAARYDYTVSHVPRALSLGVSSCYDMLRDVARTLSGILRQEVSEENLGGIITIGVIAKQTADIGLVKFFWFLCLLSLNLAFLNVLPIPLLDGGHLFFLAVEGIKGSPVNERIMSYSQLVGLVLIVSLFVFVIYNDLSMHVFN